MRRIYIIATALLTAAFAVSCTEDMEDNGNGGQLRQNMIQFTADLHQDWNCQNVDTRSIDYFEPHQLLLTENGQETELAFTATAVNGIRSTLRDACQSQQEPSGEVTRAIPKTGLTGSFGVSGYSYPTTTTWGSQEPFFHDVEATTNDNTTWTLSTTEYWKSDENTMRFFAYSPYRATGVELSGANYAGEPYINFAVSSTITAQVDLMTAASTPVTYETGIKAQLPFKHALTCVKFAVGQGTSTNLTIKSIKLVGVANKGTVYVGNERDRWAADKSSHPDIFMGDLNFSTNTSAGAIIAPSGGEQYTTLLMIPQTFDETDTYDQKIVMIYNNGSKDVTVAASLKGQEWLPGTTITYQLTTKDKAFNYVFNVTPAVIGHQGGQTTYTVTSYKSSNDGLATQTAVPWEVVGYSDDNGLSFHPEKPASCNWVGLVTTSGNGGTEGETGIMTITAQTAKKENTMTKATALQQQADSMKLNPERGYENDYYDLSTHDYNGNVTLRNTANCYVINAKGYYKLPLVYGNAIKNGAANTASYTYTVNSENKAYSHNGSYFIDNPNIAALVGKISNKIYDCVLCWQDANGLISDVQLSAADADGMQYLMFKVTEAGLAPGNAVVAVRDNTDSHTILWSWHIWCTPADLNSTIRVTNASKSQFDFLHVPVGWVSLNGSLLYYQERSMIVKLRQESGKIAYLRISQQAGNDVRQGTAGYAPFYQYGRKDPMLPSNGTNVASSDAIGTDHTQYPTNGTYLWNISSTDQQRSIPASIKNPNSFFKNSKTNNWCGGDYGTSQRFWNASVTGVNGLTDQRVVKTIYDPCPVGFAVAPSGAFTGFTTTAANSDAVSEFNVSGSWQDGYYFYTNGKGSETIFFPALGFRAHDTGKVTSVGIRCFVWAAYSSSSDNTAATRFRCSAENVSPISDTNRTRGQIIMPVKETN